MRRPTRRDLVLVLSLHNAGATAAAALVLWIAAHPKPPLFHSVADAQHPSVLTPSELIGGGTALFSGGTVALAGGGGGARGAVSP
jgi:hypothetical protein